MVALLVLLWSYGLVSFSWARPPWAQGGAADSSAIANLPYQEISEEEREGLIWMREEEKLARDVYLTLYGKWHLQVFYNIAQSEQSHMDAIKSILDKYNIPDPVVSDQVGSFSNPEIGSLYEDLVRLGSNSVVDALIVGATIEDLDIKDLKERIATTDNEDIQSVYSSLMCGSRNHLRSFVGLLKGYGADYSPQYIDEDEFLDIINSDSEFCGKFSGLTPFVDVKINSLDGRVVLSSNSFISLELSTVPPDTDIFSYNISREIADLALWVEMPNGEIYSWTPGHVWQRGVVPAYTGHIPSIKNYPLLRVPAMYLPAGTYKIHFIIDLNPNGVIEEPYFEDVVELVIQ